MIDESNQYNGNDSSTSSGLDAFGAQIKARNLLLHTFYQDSLVGGRVPYLMIEDQGDL